MRNHRGILAAKLAHPAHRSDKCHQNSSLLRISLRCPARALLFGGSAYSAGRTSKARKGTSWGQIRQTLAGVESAWADSRVMSGLSSGEGLIWAVRDEIRERSPVREKGRVSSVGRGNF